MKRTIWSILGIARNGQSPRKGERAVSHRWSGLGLFLLATSLVGAFGLVGCGSHDPMAPVDTSNLGLEPSDSVPSASDAGARESTGVGGSVNSGLAGDGLSSAVMTAKFISPLLGGVVQHTKYALVVPPLALDHIALYSVKPVAGPEAAVELGPHGSEFDVPVVISINLQGTSIVRGIGRAGDVDGDGINLYWWNEATRAWENVGGVYNPVTKTLTATLDHFSTYRAGW